MKIRSFTVGIISLMAMGAQAQTYPLSENFWSSPEFQDRVMGSYGVHSQLEPKLGEEDSEFFRTLLAVMEANVEQGATLLEQRITPDSSAALDFMLGTVSMQLGDMEKAVGSYESAIRKFPNFMRAYKNLGIAYTQSDQLEKAVGALVKGMELGGADGISYGLLGYCYLDMENFSAALNAYSLAIAFQPDSKDWKLGKVRSLIEMEAYKQTAGLIAELIKDQPTNHELYLYKANIALADDNIEEATSNLEIARRMGKGDENSLFLLADIYANRGMFALALTVYDEALSKTKQKINRFSSISRAISSLIEFEQWSYARELSDLAMVALGADLDQDKRLALLNLKAEIELGDRNSDSAAATLEEIIEVDPMNGRAILLLAKYYWQEEDFEEAAFLYQRAENIDAVAAKAYLQYGQMLVQQKDYVEGAKKLRQSLDLEYQSNVADYLRAVEEAASRL